MALKFAFLGAWHSHAVMHVREAAQRPDEFELVGMCDPDAEVIAHNLERWARHEIAVPVLDSRKAVLDSDAEVIVVEGHVYENLEYAEAALQAGKHVLLEKPAGVDLAQLERIHALAVDHGLVLNMAYMWRYNPAIQEMLRLHAAGAFGQVFQYRGHIPKPKAWHAQLAVEYNVYYGAVYFEMAGHLIDLMVAFLGEPHTVLPALACHYGDRVDVDNAMVVHECADGLGLVDTTAMQVGMDRRVEVHGTGGTALHEPLGSNRLRVLLEEGAEGYPAGEWVEREFDSGPDTGSLLREMAACIDGKDKDFGFDHDLAVQRTLLRGCGVEDGEALCKDISERTSS
ncbi:MAG: Gfo/Idh/MocA family oxidoreductase [Candidatus Latescibacterota bacterium]|nr:Gfo/Idh/MocA family oxidoreductase [Candidatus Latescibacterota bacterium]